MSAEYSQNKLEIFFSSNLNSQIFPILADLYYKQHNYTKAEKICHHGLKTHPENLLGQHILSKLLLINNKTTKARKILKNIVIKDKNNINALLTLIEVDIALKGNQKEIEKNISTAYRLLPHNKKINKLYKTINKEHTKKKSTNLQSSLTNKKKLIKINKQMATKTMYFLMLKQNKFEIAKAILHIMNKERKNKKFVVSELKKINKK